MRVCDNFELGYLSGLVVGDCSLFAQKSRNYGIRLETTDKELASQFCKTIKTLNPFQKIFSYHRIHGFSKKLSIIKIINSKELYERFRPYKKADYHWEIPSFLQDIESKRGFLKGIFDAEGGIYAPTKSHCKPYLYLFSKHEDNLRQIAYLLSEFKIESKIWHVKKNECELSIGKKEGRRLFSQIIGFRLPRKCLLLQKYGGI